MKRKILLLALIITIGISCRRSQQNQTINAIIGDESLEKQFRIKPGDADEVLRIKTHLSYVEQLLRKRTPKYLTQQQKTNRENAINLLNVYWNEATFPSNFDFPEERKPCFIDKLGNICAVGYLIEQTVGRSVAEEINDKFQYEYLMAMNDQKIDDWIFANGLTKEECAMIQPAYGGVTQPKIVDESISSGYDIATFSLSAVNLSVGTVNAIQLSKRTNSKYLPYIGLVSGASQVILGIANYPKSITMNGNNYVNRRRLNHSLINIGVGASNMILSGLNLTQNKQGKEKAFAWAIQGLPISEKELGIGVGLSLRL